MKILSIKVETDRGTYTAEGKALKAIEERVDLSVMLAWMVKVEKHG